ncbi:MAG: hypothetical protein C0624_08305 [Desulfuromonas sp.]|nr:MAG: hypothetical protein C0624_08305 [Desulfuromonas sp.]
MSAEKKASPLHSPGTGYPDAYVAARLAPRVTEIFRAHSDPRTAANRYSWLQRHRSIEWSYAQLSQRRRQQLEPIYLYAELPILLTSIRFTVSGMPSRAAELMDSSLWNADIRHAVLTYALDESLATELKHQLNFMGLPHKTLEKRSIHPLNRLEQNLYAGLFASYRQSSSPDLTKDFCSALIDLHNLTRVSRTLEVKPHLGGALFAADFRSPHTLKRALNRAYGKAPTSPSIPENHLRHAFAQKLFRRSRTGEHMARIGSFLWANMIFPYHLHADSPRSLEEP